MLFLLTSSCTQVSPDGAIYFNETTQPVPYQYSYLDQWPNNNYPLTSDPPFIAPFYSDADFDQLDPGDHAQLSFRILDISDTSKPANEQVLV